MLKSKSILIHGIMTIVLSVLYSCHNSNKTGTGAVIDKNQLSVKSSIVKDSLSNKDTTAYMDTITPPKDINKQKVLLNKLVRGIRIKMFFNKDSGEVYVLFRNRDYERLFPLGLFIGALNTPEPPYICAVQLLNDTVLVIKVIFGRTELGFNIDYISYYAFNLQNRNLIELFWIPDLGAIINDSLTSAMYYKAKDHDITQYDYHVDYGKRKVEAHVYDPFKPLSNKYKQLARKYHIQYQTKTIVDSW